VAWTPLHDVLYHLHDYQRSLFHPALQVAQMTARLFSMPGWLSQLPGEENNRAVTCASCIAGEKKARW